MAHRNRWWLPFLKMGGSFHGELSNNQMVPRLIPYLRKLYTWLTGDYWNAIILVDNYDINMTTLFNIWKPWPTEIIRNRLWFMMIYLAMKFQNGNFPCCFIYTRVQCLPKKPKEPHKICRESEAVTRWCGGWRLRCAVDHLNHQICGL